MKPEMIALLAGFFGTLLGAAVSIITIVIQQHHQTRREESRLALDAAVKEFSSAEEYAKFMVQNGIKIVTRDLPFYIMLHSRIIPLLRKKTITQDELITAHKEALDLSCSVQSFYQKENGTQQSHGEATSDSAPSAESEASHA